MQPPHSPSRVQRTDGISQDDSSSTNSYSESFPQKVMAGSLSVIPARWRASWQEKYRWNFC
eukprot:2845312-Pyramimonas_sp.AAC.1